MRKKEDCEKTKLKAARLDYLMKTPPFAITAAKLSELTEIDQGNLSNYRNGKKPFSDMTAWRIWNGWFKRFNVNQEWILGDSDLLLQEDSIRYDLDLERAYRTILLDSFRRKGCSISSESKNFQNFYEFKADNQSVVISDQDVHDMGEKLQEYADFMIFSLLRDNME